MKIVIITGLTGSGKSGLALKLAKEFNGEIISADSVQVYRGLDIGSAKESEQTLSLIPHHLINIKDFQDSYNVSNFIFDCKNAIDLITKKGKLPIVVGGTGMYIKALMEGYDLGNCANLQFREKYALLAQEKGNNFVWEQLNKINPNKAQTVHPNNIKRVIRYLESELNSATPSKKESILSGFDIITVGLIEDRQTIYNKIDNRVDEMLKSGLKKEVEGLIKAGANRNTQALNSIGYKEWFDYFDGLTDYETTVNLIKQHTRNYCKRQLTFLKTIPNLKLMTYNEAENYIRGELNDKN